MRTFIGRKAELEKLADLYQRRGANLVVIQGRRRIGKSRLVGEFARDKRFLSFTGLAPAADVSAQAQRDHFARQLATQVSTPLTTYSDWTDALMDLAHHIRDEGTTVFFDEISWMGMGDPTFIPKLKAWWDTVFSQKHHAMLVFCGSISTWIEENILKSTAFFGRISLTMELEPLSISEASQFLKTLGFKGSSYEIYKLLSVLGGIPWYLEQVQPHKMADENIKHLFFKKNGLLVKEFDHIFHDLFNGRGSTYKKILETLKEGMKTLKEIRQAIGFEPGGTLSKMIDHLVTCGFVSQQPQWSLKTKKITKYSLYRISDPYIRFYLKVIQQQRLRIDQGAYNEVELAQIPGFDATMGLQVEYLLLQNRTLLLNFMGIKPGECLFDGPYRQTQTLRTKGCQIDYLVQTRTNNLFLCEFKFKRRELGTEIIGEVQEKMDRLSLPRGFALVPVLFHLGDVQETVYDKQFFYRIIDINDFL